MLSREGVNNKCVIMCLNVVDVLLNSENECFTLSGPTLTNYQVRNANLSQWNEYSTILYQI